MSFEPGLSPDAGLGFCLQKTFELGDVQLLRKLGRALLKYKIRNPGLWPCHLKIVIRGKISVL
jgi:hypothetical protein